MAANRIIGANNTMPWRCPEDLKYFKLRTMGHHMIMGRKTFDSIGKPLPGRVSVIVSRNYNLWRDDCIIVNSFDEAIKEASRDDNEIFIVGGAEIYALALPIANKLYITEIQQDIDGDTYFPEFDRTKWRETAREKHHQDIPQPLDYHFVTYQRN